MFFLSVAFLPSYNLSFLTPLSPLTSHGLSVVSPKWCLYSSSHEDYTLLYMANVFRFIAINTKWSICKKYYSTLLSPPTTYTHVCVHVYLCVCVCLCVCQLLLYPPVLVLSQQSGSPLWEAWKALLIWFLPQVRSWLTPSLPLCFRSFIIYRLNWMTPSTDCRGLGGLFEY